MIPKLAKLLVGGLTATALTATAGGAVLAQVSPPTPAASATSDGRPDALLGALASKLGKSVDELRAAVVAAQKDLVDQAVAAGRLTPDQAARLKQRIDQTGGRGVLRDRPLGGKATPRGVEPLRQAMAGLAQFLNVDARQLGQELRAGKSLADVAKDHGKSRDQLKQYLTDQARARADQAVKDGRLTQERASKLLSNLSQRIDKMIDRVPKKPAAGQRGPGKAPRGGVSL